jgi:hypothetical protein
VNSYTDKGQMKRFTQLVRRCVFYLFRSHFRERHKFEKWQHGFEDIYNNTLYKWQQTSGYKSLLPKDLEDKVLHQYTTYKTEREARRLVRATYILSAVTAVALIISLFAFYSQSTFYSTQSNFYSNQLNSTVPPDPVLQFKLEDGPFYLKNNAISINTLSSLAYVYINESNYYSNPEHFIFRISASNKGLRPTPLVIFSIKDNESLFYINLEKRDLGNYMNTPADILFLGGYNDCRSSGQGYYEYRRKFKLCQDSRDINLTTGIKEWTLIVTCPACNINPQCYSFNICVYNSSIDECGPKWNEQTTQFVPIDCSE